MADENTNVAVKIVTSYERDGIEEFQKDLSLTNRRLKKFSGNLDGIFEKLKQPESYDGLDKVFEKIKSDLSDTNRRLAGVNTRMERLFKDTALKSSANDYAKTVSKAFDTSFQKMIDNLQNMDSVGVETFTGALNNFVTALSRFGVSTEVARNALYELKSDMKTTDLVSREVFADMVSSVDVLSMKLMGLDILCQKVANTFEQLENPGEGVKFNVDETSVESVKNTLLQEGNIGADLEKTLSKASNTLKDFSVMGRSTNLIKLSAPIESIIDVKRKFDDATASARGLKKVTSECEAVVQSYIEANGELKPRSKMNKYYDEFSKTKDSLEIAMDYLESLQDRMSELSTARDVVIHDYQTKIEALLRPVGATEAKTSLEELEMQYKEALAAGDVVAADTYYKVFVETRKEVERLTHELEYLPVVNKAYRGSIKEQAQLQTDFNEQLEATETLSNRLMKEADVIKQNFGGGLYPDATSKNVFTTKMDANSYGEQAKASVKQVKQEVEEELADDKMNLGYVMFHDFKDYSSVSLGMVRRFNIALEETRKISQAVNGTNNPVAEVGKIDFKPEKLDRQIVKTLQELRASTDTNIKAIGESLQSHVNDYRKFTNEYKKAVDEMNSYAKKMNSSNAEYTKLIADIAKVEQSITDLNTKWDSLIQSYQSGAMSCNEFERTSKRLNESLHKEESKLSSLIQKATDVKSAYANASAEYDTWSKKMDKANVGRNIASKDITKDMDNAYSAGITGDGTVKSAGAAGVAQKISEQKKAMETASKDTVKSNSKLVSQLGSIWKSFFSSLVRSVTGTLSSINGKVLAGVKSLVSTIAGAFGHVITKTLSTPMNVVKKMFKTVVSYLKMLNHRIKRTLVAQMFRDVTGTLASMASQRPEFNAAMSSMIISLRQLGTQIIAAAQPILEMLAPAIESVSRILTVVAVQLSNFTAVLNGQDKFFEATEGAYDFADAMETVSTSTAGAAKSSKKLQSTVLGFDQLNKLNGDSSSTNSEADLNTANKLSDAWQKIADKLRKAWAEKNWKDFGAGLGEAINQLSTDLKSVFGWEENADKITDFVKNVTEAFNSLVANLDPAVIGQAIGDIINSGIHIIDLFTGDNGIDFTGLGQKLGGIIKNALATIDWDTAGQAFMNSIESLVDILNGIIGTEDLWSTIGDSIHTAINGAVTNLDPEKWISLVVNIVSGMADAITTAFDNTDGTFLTFGTKIGEIINGIFEGIDGKDLAEGVNAILGAIGSALSSAFEEIDTSSIVSTISDFLCNLDWDYILNAVAILAITKLPGILGSVMPSIAPALITALGNPITAAVLGVMALIGVVVVTHFDELKPHFTQFGENIKSGWDKLKPHLTNLGEQFSELKEKCGGFFDSLSTTFGSVIDLAGTLWDTLSPIIGASLDFVGSMVFEKLESIVTIFTDIQDAASGLCDLLTGVFTGDLDTAFEGLCNFASGIGNTILDVVLVPINVIISGVNALIDGINSISIDIPDWVPKYGGKKFGGFNIQHINEINYDIPKFASGGSVGDGQMFIANEYGAEAITRGDNGRTVITNNEQMVTAVARGVRSAMIDAMMMQSSGNNSDSNGDIVIYVDSEELARASLKGQRLIDKRLNPVIQYA